MKQVKNRMDKEENWTLLFTTVNLFIALLFAKVTIIVTYLYPAFEAPRLAIL